MPCTIYIVYCTRHCCAPIASRVKPSVGLDTAAPLSQRLSVAVDESVSVALTLNLGLAVAEPYRIAILCGLEEHLSVSVLIFHFE